MSENAFVHTLADAGQRGLWPRQPKPEPEPEPEPAGGPGQQSPGKGAVKGGAKPHPAPPPRPPAQISAEGPLRQALVELFEKARTSKIKAFARLGIKFFETKGAWNMHQTMATLRDAQVTCQFEATMTAEGVKTFSVGFTGDLTKANPVKQFLEAQLRSATEQDFTGFYDLRFAAPYPTSGDKAETLIATLTKYGGGEAFVEAEADRDDPGKGDAR